MTSSPRNSLGNVRSDMDIAYPEHLSRLHRHSTLAEYPKSYYNPKKMRSRRGNRYRTQPVTFDEIQEVDEENMAMENPESEEYSMPSSISTSKLELDLLRFSKTFGNRRKKTTPPDSDVSSYANSNDKSNEDQSDQQDVRMKAVDELRWTDHAREGSV